MDPVENPFRPGAGRRPPVLAGREALLHDFDVMVRRAESYGEGDRGWVVNGLRGVGKTVLVNGLMQTVQERGWIVAKMEAAPNVDVPAKLAAELVKACRAQTGRHPDGPGWRRALGALKSFSLTWKVPVFGIVGEVEATRGVADSGSLGQDLTELLLQLGQASTELGIGTILLVDELQEASAGALSALNMAIHHLGQENVPPPVLFVGAGLPSLPALLADASSYAERLYLYPSLDLLAPEAVGLALSGPTETRGVSWQPEALEDAVELTRGYPYFVQALGRHVWDIAQGPVITTADVLDGGLLAEREINDGLYRSRWERATAAQRRLLVGIAELGGDGRVDMRDLTQHLGKSRASDLSVARGELIKKGLVYAPVRGQIAFTVPGMSRFVLDQAE